MAVKTHLRKRVVVETASTAAVTGTGGQSFDLLPSVPDDESWLASLKTGGQLKVDAATVISAVRAALATRTGGRMDAECVRRRVSELRACSAEVGRAARAANRREQQAARNAATDGWTTRRQDEALTVYLLADGSLEAAVAFLAHVSAGKKAFEFAATESVRTQVQAWLLGRTQPPAAAVHGGRTCTCASGQENRGRTKPRRVGARPEPVQGVGSAVAAPAGGADGDRSRCG